MVEAWFQILVHYSTLESLNVDLVNQCLKTVSLYVSWVEVQYIVSERFITLLYSFVSRPTLRIAAIECVNEIIAKGMKATEKINLIQSLQLTQIIKSVISPSEIKRLAETEFEFIEQMAIITNTLGCTLCECYSEVTAAAAMDEKESVSIVVQMMNELFSVMVQLLSSDYDDLAQNVLDYLAAYINLLKLEKRKRNNLSEIQFNQLNILLNVVVIKMKYDEDFHFDDEGEEEALFHEFRKILKIQLDNIAILDEGLVMDFIYSVVMNALDKVHQLPFNEVELSLRLVFLVGDTIKGQPTFIKAARVSDMSKQGRLSQMIDKMVRVNVSAYQHQAVQLEYFENVARYAKFFEMDQDLISSVLISFIDQRGLHSNHTKLKSRVSYLFNRFVKILRPHLLIYAENVLNGIQDLLLPDENVLPDETTLQNQLYLYETAGVLISLESTLSHGQVGSLAAILNPLFIRINNIINQDLYKNKTEEEPTYAIFLNHYIMCIGYLCRGFPSTFTTQPNTECNALFKQALEIILRILQTLPDQNSLKEAARFALHRFVNCLGQDVVPFLPVAISQLLVNCSMKNLIDFLPLMNQLLFRFKDTIFPILNNVFPLMIERIFYFLEKTSTSISQDHNMVRRSEKKRTKL